MPVGRDELSATSSLFQPEPDPAFNERDPARFWLQSEEGPVLNYAEFHKFCQDHPQADPRRAARGHPPARTAREKKRLFDCERPEEVVRFLR